MKKTLLIDLFWIVLISCNTQLGPGYNFNLFDKTPNKDLANAVEREDVLKIKQLLNNGEINIDLQEPAFGNTILMLAIGNSKLKATKTLLEAGANVNIRDYNTNAPINEAAKLILHEKNAYQILELLIKFGADVNSVKQGRGSESIHSSVPLSSVVQDFRCAKLLLDNGADPNFKVNNAYPVWLNLVSNFEKDNIYVVRYIIVEKKIAVPPVILYGPNGKQLSIYDFINDDDFPKDSKKQKARKDVLEYLKANS